ncbi:hypothetical protein BAE44_0011221, partial [Dichanthelium oligosanthes]
LVIHRPPLIRNWTRPPRHAPGGRGQEEEVRHGQGRGARPSRPALHPGDRHAGRVRDGKVGAGADSVGASADGEVGSSRCGGLRGARSRTAPD